MNGKPRHQHSGGDASGSAAEGVPFNQYAERMLADIESVRWLCDTLEGVAGELPNRDTSVRLLAQNIARARGFMTALAVMPTMIRTATPEDVARAGAGT